MDLSYIKSTMDRKLIFYPDLPTAKSKAITSMLTNMMANRGTIIEETMYKNIINNFDCVNELYQQKKYTEINLLLVGTKYNNGFEKYSIKQQLQYFLLLSAVKNNNMKIIEMIVDENDDDLPIVMEDIDITKMSQNILNYILQHIKLTDNCIHSLFYKNRINIECLEILLSRGIKINGSFFAYIIKNNNIDAIKYLIAENYDIQHLYDENVHLYYDYDHYYGINIAMIKFLYLNINMMKCVQKIFRAVINMNNLEAVEFLVDSSTELDLDCGFNKACESNNINIMKYLLKKGIDINRLIYRRNFTIDTVKFLIENGYNQDNINWEVRKSFCNESDLQNVKYLLKNGGNIDQIFENHYISGKYTHDFKTGDQYHYLICPIEHIIATDKKIHLEFLMDNYFDLLQLELNRLFVIACCNGRLEIAKLLLKIGAEITEKSMIFACFFGHKIMVEFLLENGLQFHDVKSVNLFTILFNNELSLINTSAYANMIVTFDKDNMLRNDIYCNNGHKHPDIIRLLIKYNVNIGDYDYNNDVHDGLLEVDILEYFFPTIRNLNEKIGKRETLLELCIMFNKYDSVKFLLENGAKPEINDRTHDFLEKNIKMYELFKKYGK